jgi:hypothetical protein
VLNEPKTEMKAHLDHDQVLRELGELADRIDPKAVASAFVASLSRSPGFWRAPLVALAGARAVRPHAFGPSFRGGACKACGLKLTNRLAPVHERGQALPGGLSEALVILRAYRAQASSAPQPCADDIRRLEQLLHLIAGLPDNAREGQLNQAMCAAWTCVGNKYDRRHVIETLGACGILETAEYPGFTTRWTSFGSRQNRPNVRVECDPPIAFWTAAHGINPKNVDMWFGHLGLRVPATSTPSRQTAVAKQTAAQVCQRARAARKTELEPGNAIAFAVETYWLAAVVIRTVTDKGGQTPVIKWYDWIGKTPPSKEMLRDRRMLGGAIYLHGLWTRNDPRGRWVFVGSGLHKDALADGFSIHRIAHLSKLARATGLVV